MGQEVAVIDNANTQVSLIESIDIQAISNIMTKINTMQALIQKTLKPEHDFGVIPGTNKPTLLKPGAEKILMMFGLTSEYEFLDKIEDFQKGFFSYSVKCILTKNGNKITEGVGHANTYEGRYRWRWVKEQDLPVNIDKDSLISRTNRWGKTEYKVENDDPYTLANTVLKMAKKRAQIDATLTVGSLSEVFTQDLEDMKEFLENEEVENMTIEDAGNIKVTFGKKHNGKTLKEILESDRSYIEWLLTADKTDAVIKKACEMLLAVPGTPKDTEKLQQQEQQEQQVQQVDEQKVISKAQAKRMFALARGNADLVKAVLEMYGYTSSQSVLKEQYEEICKEIENVAKAS